MELDINRHEKSQKQQRQCLIDLNKFIAKHTGYQCLYRLMQLFFALATVALASIIIEGILIVLISVTLPILFLLVSVGAMILFGALGLLTLIGTHRQALTYAATLLSQQLPSSPITQQGFQPNLPPYPQSVGNNAPLINSNVQLGQNHRHYNPDLQ